MASFLYRILSLLARNDACWERVGFQVWTERLREWLAAQVLQPLVAAVTATHKVHPRVQGEQLQTLRTRVAGRPGAAATSDVAKTIVCQHIKWNS